MLERELTIITADDFVDRLEPLRLRLILALFRQVRIHIRKPKATIEELACYIKALPKEERHRLFLSDHPELVAELRLGGLHLSERNWRCLAEKPDFEHPCQIGFSCHGAKDMEAFPFLPDYAYLSPVADSLSKTGYKAAFSDKELKEICDSAPFRMVALGGVTADNAAHFMALGFKGVAALGYFRTNSLQEMLSRVAAIVKPRVLLCGGIDPTGRAGLAADLLRVAELGAISYTVATAITQQNDTAFMGLTPISVADIRGQVESLQNEQPPSVAKIGLVASYEQLKALIQAIRAAFPSCRIVWDPIVATSSGFRLHTPEEVAGLRELLPLLDVITPNRVEGMALFATNENEKLLAYASEYTCSVLLKGGKVDGDTVSDVIYTAGSDRPSYIEIAQGGEDRHGTGCRYATTLAVLLARGRSLIEAAAEAQAAVSRYRMGVDLSYLPPTPQLGTRMFITHAADPEEALLQTERVLREKAADIVQLRMKDACCAQFLKTAVDMRALCTRYGVPLIINDNVEVARMAHADGVHLGKDDMSPAEARTLLGQGAIVGLTCHNEKELREAIGAPIDYIGLGPFRLTRTKNVDAEPLGLDGYETLVSLYAKEGGGKPIFAIGSVEPGDMPQLTELGLYGVAMSAALIA